MLGIRQTGETLVCARADGEPCDIQDDVILAPNLSRLVIDF